MNPAVRVIAVLDQVLGCMIPVWPVTATVGERLTLQCVTLSLDNVSTAGMELW